MQREKWNRQNIIQAANRFFSENSRYPTSHDFNLTSYLPTPPTINKIFGSLANFRKQMGQEIMDYTKGDARGKIVRSLNERGKIDEMLIYDKLKERFGEIYVHTEKEFDFRNRVDFYVYHKVGFFGVDTFHPAHKRSMANVYNIKEKKYIKFKNTIYLVVTNDEILQQEIDNFLSKRKNITYENIRLISKESFLAHEIMKYEPIKE